MGRRSIVLGGIAFLLFAVGHASATPVADLSVGKAGPATATAGTNITYTITVSNAGPSDAQSVAWTDAVPAGTTFVSDTQISGPAFTCSNSAGTINCTIATLAASATSTFTLVVDLLSSTPNGTFISNTANVSSTTFDPTSFDNSFTVSTTVTRAVPEPSSLILLATGLGLAGLARVTRRRHRRK